ncbi:MAG: hypothetical protein AAB360_01050 [Patescibacteria group bacterium]|mgnify:CR=1 FL=1
MKKVFTLGAFCLTAMAIAVFSALLGTPEQNFTAVPSALAWSGSSYYSQPTAFQFQYQQQRGGRQTQFQRQSVRPFSPFFYSGYSQSYNPYYFNPYYQPYSSYYRPFASQSFFSPRIRPLTSTVPVRTTTPIVTSTVNNNIVNTISVNTGNNDVSRNFLVGDVATGDIVVRTRN